MSVVPTPVSSWTAPQPAAIPPAPANPPIETLAAPSTPAAAEPVAPKNTETPAATPAPAAPVSKSWVLGVAGAVDLPVQNWNPVYSIGYGSKLELGLAFDPSWIAGIGLSYFHYQGVNFSGQVINDDFRAIPMVRYYPISAGIRPYLTAGAGLAVQFSAALDGTEKDINLNPGGFLGAGLELRLGAQDSLFVEGDYNLILASSTLGQDAALFGGLRCGF